ncbi:MAG: histidinol dehydrogenase [Desulfomonilaceae bacterium]|jgi:histidinol dehydrogenase
MKIRFVELSKLDNTQRKELTQRPSVGLRDLIPKITPIIEDVRKRGDSALVDYALKFDGASMSPEDFRVGKDRLNDALKKIPSELRVAIQASIINITKYHEFQKEPEIREIEIMPGIIAGEKTIPLNSAGLYVPRGKGSFPSMMMMSAVPAKVAGVKRIVATSPPDKRGMPDQATMAAAAMIGVDEFYAIGGVQAIAALACGTETIQPVDKIVGPGSGYVLAAKQWLSTEIDTGLPAGPSEAIILADDSIDALTAATDLLIEAEHGPDSSAYLVTPDQSLADTVMDTLPDLVAKLPEERRSYCEVVLSNSGGVVLADSMDDAVGFVNEFAPEHLQVLTQNPREILKHVRTAGEILLGRFTPGTLANYSIGPNAILPTSGFGRTASALSVRDFTRKMSFAELTRDGFNQLASNTLTLARYEGFPAHAAALSLRMEP